jgi:hypothetical protein
MTGGDAMVSQVDRRRLRDGAEALSLPEPQTLHEMKEQLQALMDGAVALQSMEDLGSPEANERAWNDMMELQRRHEALKRRIEKLETPPRRVRIACGRRNRR